MIFSAVSIFPWTKRLNPSFGSWLWMGCEASAGRKQNPCSVKRIQQNWSRILCFPAALKCWIRPSGVWSFLSPLRFGDSLFPSFWKTDTFVQFQPPIMDTWRSKTNTRASSGAVSSWLSKVRSNVKDGQWQEATKNFDKFWVGGYSAADWLISRIQASDWLKISTQNLSKFFCRYLP